MTVHYVPEGAAASAAAPAGVAVPAPAPAPTAARVTEPVTVDRTRAVPPRSQRFVALPESPPSSSEPLAARYAAPSSASGGGLGVGGAASAARSTAATAVSTNTGGATVGRGSDGAAASGRSGRDVLPSHSSVPAGRSADTAIPIDDSFQCPHCDRSFSDFTLFLVRVVPAVRAVLFICSSVARAVPASCLRHSRLSCVCRACGVRWALQTHVESTCPARVASSRLAAAGTIAAAPASRDVVEVSDDDMASYTYVAVCCIAWRAR
jgi:hypothetical protein